MSIDRPLVERAPAKINLTLSIVGRRADGYHLLDSLVAFAAVADEVELTPGAERALALRGPTAAAAGDGDSNLVLRAAAALAERVPELRTGRFSLLKRLPVAAGLGGGSADAAAALRLLARLNGIALDDARLMAAAAATGADVPVCLDPRPRRMSGIGEILSEPLQLPRIAAVLVNPRVATPTAAVFRALDRPAPAATPALLLPPTLSRATLVAALAGTGNDLEPAAIGLCPLVDETLTALRSLPDCLLARMSGSGATVFGLFETCRRSAAAAKQLRADHPDWWIRTTMIG